MIIELWSDYTCPSCYIGKRRLEIALEQLGLVDEVSIKLKSYEFDTNVKATSGMTLLDHFKEKYSLEIDEVNEMIEKIQDQAKELDIVYDFANTKQQNTFDAHRLVKYAYDKNKGELMSERLLKAYFTEAAEISKHEVLLNLAQEVELDEEEVMSLLSLNNYAKNVYDDINEAEELEVQGVPFFIFDDKYALSGLQPLEVFIEVIEQTIEEYIEKLKLQPVGEEGSYCVGDDCE